MILSQSWNPKGIIFCDLGQVNRPYPSPQYVGSSLAQQPGVELRSDHQLTSGYPPCTYNYFSIPTYTYPYLPMPTYAELYLSIPTYTYLYLPVTVYTYLSILSYPILSNRIQSYPIQSNSIQSYPITSIELSIELSVCLYVYLSYLSMLLIYLFYLISESHLSFLPIHRSIYLSRSIYPAFDPSILFICLYLSVFTHLS